MFDTREPCQRVYGSYEVITPATGPYSEFCSVESAEHGVLQCTCSVESVTDQWECYTPQFEVGGLFWSVQFSLLLKDLQTPTHNY